MFVCSSVNCGNATQSHYCQAHKAQCIACGKEYEAADLIHDACTDCRRDECGDELETFVSATCWCGYHGEVA